MTKLTMTDEQVEAEIIRTLETTPRGVTHWSTRETTKPLDLGHTATSNSGHSFGLWPHRTDTFNLSNAPLRR